MASRLKVQLLAGGFALHPVVRDDLGVLVLEQGEALTVELPDGQTAPLLPALAAMLEGRTVTGFIVLTEPGEQVA